MAGGIDDVEGDTALRSPGARVVHRGVLRQDRDALFALKIHGIHDPVIDILVLAKSPRLPQHGVHQSGFTVVNVGNNGNISKIFAEGHHGSLCVAGPISENADIEQPRECARFSR